MSSDKCYNHVKTLFLICNSFGFAFGWFCFASGVGMTAINGGTLSNILDILLGIWIIFVTFLGYCGAIAESSKTMHGYGTFMGVFTIKAIIRLAGSKPAPRDVGQERIIFFNNNMRTHDDKMSDAEEQFVGLIFITILTLVSLLLSWALLVSISEDTDAENTNVPKESDKSEENAVATAKLFP